MANFTAYSTIGKATSKGKMGTVWEFQDFSITVQILREINFGDSRSAKIAIFKQDLNFDFYEFMQCFEAEM